MKKDLRFYFNGWKTIIVVNESEEDKYCCLISTKEYNKYIYIHILKTNLFHWLWNTKKLGILVEKKYDN